MGNDIVDVGNEIVSVENVIKTVGNDIVSVENIIKTVGNEIVGKDIVTANFVSQNIPPQRYNKNCKLNTSSTTGCKVSPCRNANLPTG